MGEGDHLAHSADTKSGVAPCLPPQSKGLAWHPVCCEIPQGMQFRAMKLQKCLFKLFAAAALVWSTSAFAQTPANDDFANRIVLSGSSISFGGSLAGATLESNEPAYYQWLTNGATGSL
jgi:hypothetical protein